MAEIHTTRGMTPKGNQYALAALKARRAEMAGEIKLLKDKVTYRQEQLAHLDASILILDPSFPVETIAPRRPRRVKLFKHGELGRLILDTLRRANGKLPVYVGLWDVSEEALADMRRESGIAESVLEDTTVNVLGAVA